MSRSFKYVSYMEPKLPVLKLEQKRLAILLVNSKTGEPLSRIAVYAEALVGNYLPFPETTTLEKLSEEQQILVTDSLERQLAYDGDTERFEVLLHRILVRLQDTRSAAAGMIDRIVLSEIGGTESRRAMPKRTIPLGVLATDHIGFASFDIEGKQSTSYRVYAGLEKPIIVNIQQAVAAGEDSILVKTSLNAGKPLKSSNLPSMQKPSLIEWTLSPGSFAAVPSMLLGQDGCKSLTPANFATSSFTLRQVQLITDPDDGSVPFPLVYITEYTLSVIPIGHSLGSILYSLPLAPGESVRLAVIDWRRQDAGQRDEGTGVTEALLHDQSRDRLITETVQAALEEWQRGGSVMGGMATGAGAAMSMGSYGAAGGIMSSIGGAYTTSKGSRDLTATTTQNVADAVHQSSTSQRELHSSVVVQTDEKESESVQTRTFFNNNRGHTLTVMYYEILRHFRLNAHYKRRFRGILFPRVDWNLSDDVFLLSKRHVIEAQMLDESLVGNWEALKRGDLVRKERERNPPVQLWNDESQWVFETFIFLFGVGLQPSTNAFELTIELYSGEMRQLLFGGQGNVNSDEQFKENTRNVIQSNPAYIKYGDIRQVWMQKTSDRGNDALRLIEVTITGRGGGKDQVIHQHIQGTTYYFDQEGDKQVFDINRKPAPRTPANVVLTLEQQMDGNDYGAIAQLKQHLNAEAEHYKRILDLSQHPNFWAKYFEGQTWSDGVPLLKKVSPNASEILGSNIAFPLTEAPRLEDQFDEPVPDAERLISLPTRGTFAEAKLGHCNVAEEIDETRFWRWDEHPNPLVATEINPITTVTPEPRDPPLNPTELPPAVVNIQNPLAVPDPTGMAAVLNAITKGDSFRDMSAIKEVAGMLSDLTKAAVSMAQAAASLVKTGSGGNTGGGSSGETGGTAPSTQKPSSTPITTTKEQQTTPKEAADAIKVIENQVAKGNVPKEAGSAQIQGQLSNMKGSKPVEQPPERQRAILFRLIGWQGTTLVGDWSWELTQLVVIPGPDNVSGDAVLDLNETPQRYNDGRFVANFRHDPADGPNFNLKLEGWVVESSSQVSHGENKTRKTIAFTVPEDIFEKRNVATVTIVATTGQWTSTKKKGKEAVEEWKTAGSVEGSGGGESETGGNKVLAGIKGSVSKEKTVSETTSEETEQQWTFFFYTGGFEEPPTVT